MLHSQCYCIHLTSILGHGQQEHPPESAEKNAVVIEKNDESPSSSSEEELEHDDDDDNDPAKLTERYVRLKSLLFRLETKRRRPKQSSKIKAVQAKISTIQGDVLFDEYVAEESWRATLDILRAEHLLTHKNLQSAHNHDPASSGKSQHWLDSTPSRTSPSRSDAIESKPVPAEGEADDLFGNMFGSAGDGDLSIGSKSESLQNIKLLNFGKWTGASPRMLLEESCKSCDPKARVKFDIMQKTSWSARHRVQIMWSNSRRPDAAALEALPSEIQTAIKSFKWTFEMTSVAATDLKQSEAYASTLALFVVFNTDSTKTKISNRLPQTWRDLLKCLNDTRQVLTDEQDKTTLRHLRHLLDSTKQDLESPKAEIVPKQSHGSDGLESGRTRPSQPNSLPLGPSKVLEDWNARTSRPAYQDMLQVRSQLPVHQYKDEILHTVNSNPVTIICAETGAGKSSGIPVLILEQQLSTGKDSRIMVTQPRRISAITLARRVSQELGDDRNDIGTHRSLVGYAIRLESKTSSSTRITYATTGVLLRILEDNPNLSSLDYLILDEVHERTMDLDLLFIALRKLQERQQGLKIILMSATVDARKFSDYFGGAPVLDLPGRTFPVEVGFLEDAIEATNGRGGVQDNIRTVEDGNESSSDDKQATTTTASTLTGYSAQTRKVLSEMDEYRIPYALIAKVAATIATSTKYIAYSKAILIFLPGLAEIRRLHNILSNTQAFTSRTQIHTLHSSLATSVLEAAFQPPPNGHIKIVLATNIAETGITIPDITAVIDTAKEKLMRYSDRRSYSKLTESFVSRSSIRQRRGRAARVQPGLCFHLITRRRHDELLLETQVPEMLRLSLQDAILRIKTWSLTQADPIESTLGLALDAPTSKSIARSVAQLTSAGALTAKQEQLTSLGKLISRLPLSVSHGKLAIYGCFFNCLDQVMTIIAVLTSKSPFLSSAPNHNQPVVDSRSSFVRSNSDLLTSLQAYESWRRASQANSSASFCRRHQLSEVNMMTIEETKISLFVSLADTNLIRLDPDEKSRLNSARSSSSAGRGKSFYEIPSTYNKKMSDEGLLSLLALSFSPHILAREGKGYRNVNTNQRVAVSSRSINHHSFTGTPQGQKPARYLSFDSAFQTPSGSLQVSETSPIPECALPVLLGSNADWRVYAGVLDLDHGKLRLSCREWKEVGALKLLREGLEGAFDAWLRKQAKGKATGALDGNTSSIQERKWVDIWLKMVDDNEDPMKRAGGA